MLNFVLWTNQYWAMTVVSCPSEQHGLWQGTNLLRTHIPSTTSQYTNSCSMPSPIFDSTHVFKTYKETTLILSPQFDRYNLCLLPLLLHIIQLVRELNVYTSTIYKSCKFQNKLSTIVSHKSTVFDSNLFISINNWILKISKNWIINIHKPNNFH